MPVLALPLWQARGPRFLVLLLGLWVLVRLASYWPGEVGAVPPPSLFAEPPVLAGHSLPVPSDPSPVFSPPIAAKSNGGDHIVRTLLARPVVRVSQHALTGYAGSERHAWRLALLQRFGSRPGGGVQTLAMPQRASQFAPGLAPLQPLPRWPDGATGRWSLAVASYWRGSDGTPALGPTSTARLGASQLSARLSYVVDPRLSLRAYVRAAHTPGRRDGADVAVGVALRPFKAIPVDVYAERRTVVAGQGRDTTLVYAAGGIDDRQLPLDFRLSAYAQAGVADYGKVVGFADGVVVVQREVAARRGMRLSLGTMLGAAAQPGAERIDIGPRAALALPEVGQGAQIALDWRERVAGNARPGSGLALTLAAEF